MTFLWPQLLWLLWAVPALVLAYAWLLRRQRRLVLRFPSLALVRPAAAGLRWRRHLPPALALLALAALLLAAARPLARVPLLSDHATVMLAMDVSLSMHANDIKPNRLAAAQAAAKVFLQELPPHVRVGIVTFAGTAQVVQPATRHRADLVAAIDRFQLQRGTAVGSSIVVALSELFPDEGIDLGELTYGTAQGLGRPRGQSLDTPRSAGPAAKAFVPVPPGSYTSAAVVLLTDGRNTTGLDPMQAADMAAQHGVRVYAVGLGTEDGGAAGVEGWSAYLRLDEPMLQEIAQRTRGSYFQADSADALRQVYQQLGTRLEVETRETEVAGLLALGALAALAAAGGLSLWWSRRSI